ncbi:hypothetical protein GCM10011506_29840 [Marivirga lumbricoides]|uniref:KAP NTPase domain-containing protein n=1 Tax=Marivirga lumbricoides TaxID=1046115 RepID=A0ABQ1MKT4_9BACT|nr:hypothetical protein GCM10011506_29840 [Marivirga lumbricoides]
MTKYPYTILTEEATNKDLFGNKAHERIAKTIYQTIKENDKGLAIGIEGEYGSGKSTVVRHLKEQLDKEKDLYATFYFDAWAHESDPLRRVFLESMIKSCCEEKNEDISILQSNIKYNKTTDEKSKKGKISKFAIVFSVILFLIPVGIQLLGNVNYSNLTLICTECNIDWLFVCGLFFSLFPILLIVLKIIYLKSSGKDILDLSQWQFINRSLSSTPDEKVITEQERTSIEFQEYFDQILNKIFIEKDKKLIIFIDNLDRIEEDQALKVFSTLQIFLQHRNGIESTNSLHDKIYTVIPFDPSGIGLLWEQRNSNSLLSHVKKPANNSISFLDKILQVRINVPNPVVKGWKETSGKLIDQSLSKWNRDEINVVKNVFHFTNTSPDFNPKPREIKIYINQVGLLRNHFGKQISTEAISYFVMKKYVQKFSINEIKEMLNISFSEKTQSLLKSPEVEKEIAAILYDVKNINDAYILLLQEKLVIALSNHKDEEVLGLEKAHEENFWSVIRHFVSTYDDQNLYNIIGCIYKCFGLDKLKESSLQVIKIKANQLVRKPELIWKENSIHEDKERLNTIACFSFSKDEVVRDAWFKLYKYALTTGTEIIEENQNAIVQKLKNLNLIYEEIKVVVGDNKLELQKGVNWQFLAKVDYQYDLKLNRIITVSQIAVDDFIEGMKKVFNEIDEQIELNISYELLFLDRINMIKEADLVNLTDGLFYALKKREEIHSSKSKEDLMIINLGSAFVDLLYQTSVKYSKLELLKGIVSDSKFYEYVSINVTVEADHIFKLATIRAYILKEEYHNYLSESIAEDFTYMSMVYGIFKKDEVEFAKYLCEDLKRNSMWKTIWSLIKLHDSPVMRRVLIQLILENQKSPFQAATVELNYYNGLRLLSEKGFAKHFRAYDKWFLENSNIEKESLDTSQFHLWVEEISSNQKLSNADETKMRMILQSLKRL